MPKVFVTAAVSDDDSQTGQTFTYEVSPTAQEAVRFMFNPSALEAVTRLKALSSAFISECERLQASMPHAGREFAVAKTEMQTASMWSVLGATKGL